MFGSEAPCPQVNSNRNYMLIWARRRTRARLFVDHRPMRHIVLPHLSLLELALKCSRFLPVLACLAFTVAAGAQSFTFTPNTTLAAESGNNTSAASSFTAQTNGNAAPTNTSKLPT